MLVEYAVLWLYYLFSINIIYTEQTIVAQGDMTMANKLSTFATTEKLKKVILKYNDLKTEYDETCQKQASLALKKLTLAKKCSRLQRYLVKYLSADNARTDIGNFHLEVITTSPVLEIYDIKALPEEFLIKQNETRVKKNLLKSKLMDGQIFKGAKLNYMNQLMVSKQSNSS